MFGFDEMTLEGVGLGGVVDFGMFSVKVLMTGLTGTAALTARILIIPGD